MVRTPSLEKLLPQEQQGCVLAQSPGGAKEHSPESAGGAKEYSPERSAAEFRDLTYLQSNPFRGVTEMPGNQVRPRFADGIAFRRPFQGLCRFGSRNPEFRSAPLRALIRRTPRVLFVEQP